MLLLPFIALAAPPAYAVVVGNNAGGPGQTELRFAEDDARRFADVLVELGRYQRDDVLLVTGATREGLTAALEQAFARLSEHAARGERASFVFYYSGHARADGLELGGSQLSLTDLRQRLLALPASLAIVVLDACQSGAFSRVKGAGPAADFSYNSVTGLETTGLAVMASSTGAELSQESDALGASYFSHHLLVGLRGAGDTNRDGMVSLDEAYRYAYGRTLAATSVTAVGGQHATLETELKGRGDVALTYPAAATAHLELAESFTGRLLVQHEDSAAVLAEIEQASGDPLRLALPPGRYLAVMRREGEAWRCRLELSAHKTAHLDADACEPVHEDAAAKGSERPRLWLELGIGSLTTQRDAYTKRLGDFGFTGNDEDEVNRFAAGIWWGPSRHISVGLEAQTLEGRDLHRDAIPPAQRFIWSSQAVGLRARGVLPYGRLAGYAQGGIGAVHVGTKLSQADAGKPIEEAFWGVGLSLAAGLHYDPWNAVGFFAQVGYDRAPALENLLGEVHDVGGPSVLVGMRLGQLGHNRRTP